LYYAKIWQGRYSFVGAQPTIEIVAKENMVTVMDHEEGKRTEERVEDPMVIPRRIMEGWKPQLIDELPEVFCGKRIRLRNYFIIFVDQKPLYLQQVTFKIQH
jgi:anthranilate synthase component 1